MSEDEIGLRARPKKKSTLKQLRYKSPDGIKRSKDLDARINEAFAITFNSAAGQTVIDYLKSITVNKVIGPGAAENTYSYHEGARWLMGVISTRRQDGEDKKP